MFPLVTTPSKTNQHQSTSININQHQSTSININQHQSTSININQHQSTSIKINQNQPKSTNPFLNAFNKAPGTRANVPICSHPLFPIFMAHRPSFGAARCTRGKQHVHLISPEARPETSHAGDQWDGKVAPGNIRLPCGLELFTRKYPFFGRFSLQFWGMLIFGYTQG